MIFLILQIVPPSIPPPPPPGLSIDIGLGVLFSIGLIYGISKTSNLFKLSS